MYLDFLLFDIALLVFVLISIKKISGSLIMPSIFNISLVYLIIFSYIGLFVIDLGLATEEDFYNQQITKEVVKTVHIFIYMSMFMLIMGGYFINFILRANPKKVYKKFLYKPVLYYTEKEILFFGFIFVLISIVFTLFFYRQLVSSGISHPIFELIEKGNYMQARMAIAFSGIKTHYIIAFGYINFIISLFILYTKRKTNYRIRKIMFLLLFYFYLLNSLFLIFMTGVKSYIIFLYLISYLIAILVNKANNFKSMFKIIGFIFLFLTILFIIMDDSKQDILRYIMSRIFLQQLTGIHLFYTYIESHNFLYGTGFVNVAGIFPYEPVFIAREVVKSYFGHSAYSNFYSVTTHFSANLFANFGYIGILLISFIMGICLRFYDVLMYIYFKKTILNLIVYSYFMIVIAVGLGAGAVEAAFIYGNMDMYLVLLMVLGINIVFKVKKNENTLVFK